MVRGLYTGAQGMLAGIERVDALSHNLANANTPAYKRLGTTAKSFSSLLARSEKGPANSGSVTTVIGSLGVGIQLDQSYCVRDEGSLRATGSRLHAAMRGDGYFVVETPVGERYTRDGRFLVDAEGYLATIEGHRVLGEDGPVLITAHDAEITEAGEIRGGGEILGRLRIVDFPNPQGLRPQGSSLYAAGVASGRVTAMPADLAPGHIEESNVNVVAEMVELLAATRAYEANQRVIVACDDCLGKAISEIAKV